MNSKHASSIDIQVSISSREGSRSERDYKRIFKDFSYVVIREAISWKHASTYTVSLKTVFELFEFPPAGKFRRRFP